MSITIAELDAMEKQVSAIEKDLLRSDFFRQQLDLARHVAARKMSEAAENIALLKEPGIVVSITEFSKIKKTLKEATIEVKRIDTDLSLIKTSTQIAQEKVKALKESIENIKKQKENNILQFKDDPSNDEENG